MKSAVAVVLLATSVFGIPSSLLEDVKVAKMRPARSPSIYLQNKDMADMQYYSGIGDQRIKRAPVKRRSIPRVRSKRDSEIDPKELLLLLALYGGKLGNLRGRNRLAWGNYPTDLNDGEWGENIDDSNQLPDVDGSRSFGNGEWLDGPIVPNIHSNQLDDMSSENDWDFKNNNRKRFMVSKRTHQNGDDAALAHLFNNNNNQFWDYNIPVYRRMIL